MSPQHDTLLAIQERDRKILDLKNTLQRLPDKREMAQHRLKDHQQAVDTAQNNANQNEIATKNLELDIQTRRDTISKLKTQQYETKKNEEYRAMGHEIERYGKEAVELEDKELVLMEELETLKATLKEAKAALAETQSSVDEELAALDITETNASSQIAELEAEVTALKAKVDPDLCDLYERLISSKGDYALVPVENGVCGGCHMKIPPDNIHQAEAAQTTVNCIDCGRIVYTI